MDLLVMRTKKRTILNRRLPQTVSGVNVDGTATVLLLLLTGCGDLMGNVIAAPDDTGDQFEGDPFLPGDPGAADVRFTLDTREDVHPISPHIYGLNDTVMLSATRPTALHLGSNRISAYNWETNDSNAGSDYQHQNDDYIYALYPERPPPSGLAAQPYVDAAVALKVLSIPINDYVAGDSDFSTGDVINSGENYLETRFKQNRAAKNATYSIDPDKEDAYVYQDEFVNWVRNNNNTGQVVFSLDNDPDKWDTVHPRIRPKGKLTFEELVNRNIEYAKAVKAAWPDVGVAGFAAHSWLGLATLNTDISRNDTLVIHQYLDAMLAESGAVGSHLIDYLEVHYFSEAVAENGDPINAATETYDPESGAEARMQAPRSLWDPTYIETPGMGTNAWLGNEGLAYIPRLKQIIKEHYPGLKLLFSIWSFGGSDHISGAIAAADTLGILGREEVDAAMNFEFGFPKNQRDFLYAGFRVYRNFGQAGETFGDTSFGAETDAIEMTSVYASYDENTPQRMVIVAINKANTALNAGITIANPVSYKRLEVYLLEASTPEVVHTSPLTRTHRNAFLYNMPARSVSVLLPAL
jgi:hypothetical protein